MDIEEIIKCYHSLPWLSSRLSCVLGAYAEKLNRYHQQENLSVPNLLIFFHHCHQQNRFQYLFSPQPEIIRRHTIPFLKNRSFFLESLNSVWQAMGKKTDKSVREAYKALIDEHTPFPSMVAYFFHLLSNFPIPIKFVDGFLFHLVKEKIVKSSEHFIISFSKERDLSNLPKFSVKSYPDSGRIRGAQDGILHAQADRPDIEPVTFYRDWIGAVTGVRRINVPESEYGLWVSVAKGSGASELAGFVHSSIGSRDKLQAQINFWTTEKLNLQEALIAAGL